MEKIESNKYPGFFVIPEFSNYVINENGTIFNINTDEEIKGWLGPNGYINVTLRTKDNRKFLTGKHRLLMIVFRHPGKPIDNLIVNHRDGNKLNISLDNLEWTTYQENAEHAGLFGLTSKCIPIEVRNALTGEIKEYPSIIECAREFGVTKDYINWRINHGKGKVFPEKFQYRAKNSNVAWIETQNNSITDGRSRAVILRDILNKKIFFYDKLTDLSKKIDVPISTLYQWCENPAQPVLPGLIQLKWAQDSTPWRDFQDPYLELELFTKCRVIKVTNPKTNTSQIYESAAECARDCGLSVTALNYRLNSKRETPFSDGLKYEYYNKLSYSK